MIKYFTLFTLLIFCSCKTNQKATQSTNASAQSNVEEFVQKSIKIDSMVIAPTDYLKVQELTKDATSNVFFVRHAEKIKDGVKNPGLTSKGIERSKVLSDLLKEVKLSAVYSTRYKRTQSTALPTANSQGLQVIEYNAAKIDSLVMAFSKQHENENILIVGHSNSTPRFINAMMHQTKLPPIDESDSPSLFSTIVLKST